MFQGNWTCSKCGGVIKELPFEPKSNSGLTCRECYFKEKDGGQVPVATGAASAAPVNTGAGGDEDDREVPAFDPDASGIASEPAPEHPEMASAPAAGEKQMFTGNWNCAGCGSAITQLPFMPRDTSNLKCIDCFKKSR